MTRRRSLLHCVFVVLLALSIVATGIPALEVHAHGEDFGGQKLGISADQHDALETHLEDHHSHDGQTNGQHVHDGGLFSHGPGVSGPVSHPPSRDSSGNPFSDPSSFHLQSHTSPLLRPPARP